MGTTFARGLLSGAATRAAKEALLHPLDTLKTREQLPALLSNGSAALAKLYSGVVPAVIGGIPAGAVFFGVKDLCKEQLRAAGVNRDVATLVGVCAANLPYWLIRTPAELLKTRQQANVSLLGPFQDLLDVTRRAGLAGAYSAYWSNVAYAVPADVLKFIACTSVSQSVTQHLDHIAVTPV
jgi:solute carrier family 25 S-adenosylmethionine transporter 26